MCTKIYGSYSSSSNSTVSVCRKYSTHSWGIFLRESDPPSIHLLTVNIVLCKIFKVGKIKKKDLETWESAKAKKNKQRFEATRVERRRCKDLTTASSPQPLKAYKVAFAGHIYTCTYLYSLDQLKRRNPLPHPCPAPLLVRLEFNQQRSPVCTLMQVNIRIQ